MQAYKKPIIMRILRLKHLRSVSIHHNDQQNKVNPIEVHDVIHDKKKVA
jgi:hypothetical protein